jgi:hypothetical protein
MGQVREDDGCIAARCPAAAPPAFPDIGHAGLIEDAARLEGRDAASVREWREQRARPRRDDSEERQERVLEIRESRRLSALAQLLPFGARL